MEVYVFRIVLYINSHIIGYVVNLTLTKQQMLVKKKKKDCHLAGIYRNFDIKHNYNKVIKSNCHNYRLIPANVQ